MRLRLKMKDQHDIKTRSEKGEKKVSFETLMEEPEYRSSYEGLQRANQEFGALAKKSGLSVSELTKRADEADVNGEYREAVLLLKQIAHYKYFLKAWEGEEKQPREPFDIRKLNPRFQTSAEAVVGLTKELEALASRLGMPVERLLQEAGSSSVFKDEYLEARSLASQIGHHKRFAEEKK